MSLELRQISAADTAGLYADPYIARVGHDHRPAAPIEHPHAQYVGAFVHGEFQGAFLQIETGWVEHEVHALLTRKALPVSRDLGMMMIARVFGNPMVQRITAQILEGLETAVNYCKRLGFVVEGFRRECVQIGGELRGVHMLGLTRRDWEAQLS